jgi:hypothetical protein
MDLAEVADQYSERPDDELIHVVVSNYDLTEAILSAHPEMAEDAGFELFDPEWARRYWKTLASDISGLQAGDKIQAWAVGATISGVAGSIITTFGLPAIAVSSAVALAIILVRAARSSSEE